MCHFRRLVCCAVLLSTFSACARRPAPESRAGDEQIIRELEKELSEAVSQGDLAHLVSLYSDDAALYYEDNPAVTGKDAIRETWRSILSQPRFSMTVEPLEVEVPSSGNLAFARGGYTTSDSAGETVADRGEYAVVYMRQPAGQWKIIADNGNSGLRAHSLPKPANRPPQRLPSLVAPVIGVVCLSSGVWFLVGMPVVFSFFAWKSLRSRQLRTGFLVSAVMLIAFLVTATLLWRHIAAHYWNLSFLTALDAAGDAVRYGHPLEHTAEVLLVNLLIFSTLSATAAVAVTGSARYLWGRGRRSVESHPEG